MQIDMYWASLAVLGSTVLVAAGHGVVLGTVRGWRSGNVPVVAAVGAEENAVDGDAKRFRSVFLRVYLTVMASEWLQVRRHSKLRLGGAADGLVVVVDG